ncbi:hypothetical protein KAR91_73830 [Candidatus Pacearchaeota archaeon]|nr:hypothetical protein [Candidatus Pacearchaeota archaeon]
MKTKKNKLISIKVIIQLKRNDPTDPDKFEELVKNAAEGEKKIKEYLSNGYIFQWGETEDKVERDYFPPHQIERATLVLEYT